jgi:hypothetical protein
LIDTPSARKKTNSTSRAERVNIRGAKELPFDFQSYFWLAEARNTPEPTNAPPNTLLMIPGNLMFDVRFFVSAAMTA